MDKSSTRSILNKDRITYLDIARALTIFCVILGHVVDSSTNTKSLLYAFHMPAFFFLSGIFCKDNVESVDEIKRFIRRRFYRLLVPYIVWGCIYSQFSFKNLLYICYGTRETLIRADSLTSLWFLPTLFVADIIVELMIYAASCLQKKTVEFVGTILFLVIGFMMPHTKFGDPLGIDIAFVAASFMMFGHISKKVIFKKRIRLQKFGTALIFGLLGCVCLGIGIYFNNPSVGYVLMANAIYGNAGAFLLGALGGTVILLSLSICIYCTLERKNALIWIGQNTMGIFLVHKPFVELFRKFIGGLGFDYNCIPLTIFIALMSLALSCIVVQIITMFMPALFGKD